jgi:hypothetical protein
MLHVKPLSQEERSIRIKLRDDFIHYAAKCLKIRSESGSIEPLVLNRTQLHIHNELERQKGATGKVRALILKGRQQGCSTYVGARFYHKTSHAFGVQAFILTHALDATSNLYKMAQRYHANTPEVVRPKVSTNNSKELIFGLLDSGYKVGTAENKSVGRSSTIQMFHGSEVAFWSNCEEHAKGILQAIPEAPGTEVILESTANGVGNYFHQAWQKAEAGLSEYIPIFCPWYWKETYVRTPPEGFTPTPEELDLIEQYGLSDEQLCWRRNKIVELSINGIDGEKSFKQEYPNNATEAFQISGEDSFIDSSVVVRARKSVAEKFGPLIIACDPARFGDDRTSIIRRRGRCAYGLESYVKRDTMEVVGILQRIIEREKPEKLCIDVGGLGAGIVDRLYELGHRDIVIAINAGSKPYDADKYYNKRSEMWGQLKEWLNDEPCQIPDTDSLHADLCGLKYKYDSNSRLRMETKEDAKKRGIRSPDEADSLCFVANTLIKTPKGEMRIDQLKVGDEVETPLGNTKIAKIWVSDTNSLTTARFSNGSSLCGKGAHKIFNWNNGACRLDALSFTIEVEPYSKWRKVKWQIVKLLLIKGRNSEFKALVDTINHTIGMGKNAFYIVAFGLIISALFQKAMWFITKIIAGATIIFPTWRLCQADNIPEHICKNTIPIQKIDERIENILIKLFKKPQNGINPHRELHGISNMASEVGLIESQTIYNAQSAKENLQDILTQNSAPGNAAKRGHIQNKKHSLKNALFVAKNFWQTSIAKWNVVPNYVQTEDVQATKVYNLTLEKHNVYYANDILVYNCLTFALPSSAYEQSKATSKVSKKLASNFKQQLNAIAKAINNNVH